MPVAPVGCAYPTAPLHGEISGFGGPETLGTSAPRDAVTAFFFAAAEADQTTCSVGGVFGLGLASRSVASPARASAQV